MYGAPLTLMDSRQTGLLPPRTRLALCLTPVSCYHQSMAIRIPPEVLEYLRKLGQAYGSQGGKKAAKNMTAAERKARAKKASLVAARKRTAARLARERAELAKKSPKH